MEKEVKDETKTGAVDVLKPEDFGLVAEDANKVALIVKSFEPKIIEREALAVIYKELITGEITKELCKKAKELGGKLQKVRKGIADIHKTEKAFYLAAGKYIDAWKNKETLPITQMEEKLEEIETYFERQEAARIAAIEESRKLEVAQYTEIIPQSLGLMQDDVYANFLTGLKVAKAEKERSEKEAEEKRQEEIRLDKLEQSRKIELAPFAQFSTADFDLRNSDEPTYQNYLESLKKAKNDYDAEQEKIRKENEKLKKEAEEKEAALKAEREASAKALAEQEAKAAAERKAIEEKAAKEKAEAEAKIKAERDKAEKEAAIERERQAKIIAEQQEKAKAEREAQQKIIDEQNAKIKAEEEAKKAEQERIFNEQQKAAKASDKIKFLAVADKLKAVEFPELKSEIGQQLTTIYQAQIVKFCNWIKTEAEKL